MKSGLCGQADCPRPYEFCEACVRADERERTNTVGGHRQIREEGRADMCNDLRAKVEALPTPWFQDDAALMAWQEYHDAVLALIDGGSDD